MTNDVKKFDPASIMQNVKDRIRDTFAGMIPDDQWEIMVQKEVDAFFQPRQTTISRRTEQVLNIIQETSPFRDIVWEYCANMAVKILKDNISEEVFQKSWNIDELERNNEIAKVIASAAPLAMTNFFEKIMLMQLSNMRNMLT